MAEKKATEKKVAAKKTATKTTATKTTTKRCATKKAEVVVNVDAESVGFRAGDVYQALAAAGKALSVQEIAKAANISSEEVYLGIGWLFKEGKVRTKRTSSPWHKLGKIAYERSFYISLCNSSFSICIYR